MENISDELIEIMVNDLIHPTIDDVISGHANEQTIRHFATTAAGMLLRNEPMPPKIQLCLTHALLRIGNGDDPAKAFNIKHGSKRKSNYGQNRIIAFLVILGKINLKLNTKNAIAYAANLHNKSPDTVEKIYYQHKKEITSKLGKKTRTSN